MRIIVDDLSHPQVHALLEEHLEDMRATSPPESVHALDLSGLKHPTITFFSAWENDELLGCIAIKQHNKAQGCRLALLEVVLWIAAEKCEPGRNGTP